MSGSVRGDRGHGVVEDDSNFPISIGGQAVTGSPTAVDNTDRVRAHFDEYGKQAVMIGDDGATNFAATGPMNSDGLAASGRGLLTRGYDFLYNGTSWDRERSNEEITVLASAARTATVSSADLTNYNARGVIITIDVTADPGTASVTPTVEIKDSVGALYDIILSATAVDAVGTFVYVIYPSTLTAAANGITQVLQNPLPRTWRVTMTHPNTQSLTYSVSASYIL